MNTKIKRVIGCMAVGLAGLVGGSGCTTTPYGNAIGRGLFETAAFTAVQSGIEGQLNPQGTNVNVYNSAPQAQIVQPISKSYNTCISSWKDRNGNNYPEAEEMIEKKTDFNTKESIFVAMSVNGYNGSTGEIRVRDNEGALISQEKYKISKDRLAIFIYANLNESKAGIYKYEFFIDGELVENRFINLIESE